MGLHFGCDMATLLDQGELTRVASALQAPAFVGRYLPTYALQPEEIAYLHARGGRLLCIDNESQDGLALGGGYDAGRAHGVRAALAWKALGAPNGVCIYLDVEQGFYVAPAYLAGFADGCAVPGLVGGCYINSLAGNGHNESYSAARRITTEPIPIFASEPQLTIWRDTVLTSWEPAAPDGHLADVAVHQYMINFGDSDLDVATDAGLAMMWGPAVPAPKRFHISIAGALKVSPFHASAVAIDPHGKPVFLELGADIVPKGRTVRDLAGESWTEVHLTAGEAVVHGWLPSQSIQEGA